MKIKFLFVVAAALGSATALAQLRITSFTSSGDLTWTNSVTNAVYRLQWAANAAGQWNSFSTQTNLNSIQAHSNRVTVNVPIGSGDGVQFLRVGWSDAPPYAGLYDLREYDLDGNLFVTGTLWLAGERGSARLIGTRNLAQVSGAPGDAGPQLGSENIVGTFDATYAYLGLDAFLTPYYNDNNVSLTGYLVGNAYQGEWDWMGQLVINRGWFKATRQKCDPQPPPDPVGRWAYFTSETYGAQTTGTLAFATSTCPITGTWNFGNRTPQIPSLHLHGQGSFTDVSVSGNTLTIQIPAGDTAFEVKGEMAAGFYCGFFQWATNNVPMGFRQTGQFNAYRTSSVP